MRLRLRVFGRTICSFTVDTGPVLELVEEEECLEPVHGITGGGAHNFERDVAPLAANHEEPWYDDRFGFRP